MSKIFNTKLIPKYRFPIFKNEEAWEEKSLEEVTLFLKGKGISKSDIIPNGKKPCIRYGELYTHYKEIIDATFSYTDLSEDDLILSEANDVIIPSSGETQEDISTASCVLRSGVALSGDINILRSSVNGIFLAYYLTHIKKNAISKLAQGNAVVHLYSSQLKKLLVNIPKNKKEQQKIAACLSSLDDVITAESKKLELLKEHKKGLLHNLFPQEGETVPRLRFKEFEDSGEWVEKMLIDCLLKNPEYGINAPAVQFTIKLPTYLRITDISEDGRFLSSENVSVDREVTENNYLSEGDIVFARTGASVGKSYKYRSVDGRLVFAGFLIRVKPDSTKLNSEFLFQFLSTNQYWNWVSFISARSGQPGINATEYASMPLNLPPSLSEQQIIADTLSSIDELLKLQSQKVEALKLHKKGLLQGLFPDINEVN